MTALVLLFPQQVNSRVIHLRRSPGAPHTPLAGSPLGGAGKDYFILASGHRTPNRVHLVVARLPIAPVQRTGTMRSLG